MINTRSLHFRLIVWYSALVIAALLAFAAYTYHGLHRKLYSDMEHTLSRRAHQIADNILAQETQPRAIAHQIHSVYSPEANNRFIRIVNPDHSVLYISGKSQDGRFDPASIPVIAGNPPPIRIDRLADHNTMLILTIPALVHDVSYSIEMGMPTEDIENTLHGLLLTLLWGLPVIILIVSAGGYWLIRRSLQPVENIRSTAQQITFGNLSNRLPMSMTGDALEHLSVTLNQMLDRLENAYEQASRFSADASHELRTPLTIMRGELEALVREKDTPARLQERIGSVLEETERLSRIAESLLAISRLDAGEARMEQKECDLAALAQNTAEQMTLLAEEKQIALHIYTPEPVMVSGDSARLKQVVVNLLDNAIKYTGEHGNVWLKVSMSPQKAVLEVRDDGIGIPSTALPHLFERFYRVDEARSRATGGAGLGLSIVRSICVAHGGNIEIQSAEGQGTLCRVELPILAKE